MIPLRDENPTSRPALVTWLLIAVCVAVFLLQQDDQDELLPQMVRDYAMVPARVFGDGQTLQIPVPVEDRFGMLHLQRIPLPPARVPEWLTLFTCMFLHGSWLHLIGNLWILWIFGDNVEDRLGRLGYLVFYLLCGAVASLSHLLAEPHSTAPTVGASGAIAGVMGAYFLLYPRSRVLALIPLGFFLQLAVVPAWLFLGLWFLLQLLQGALTRGSGLGGVAWWAHIGGFAVGLAVAAVLRARGSLRPPPVVHALQARRIGMGGPRRPWM